MDTIFNIKSFQKTNFQRTTLIELLYQIFNTNLKWFSIFILFFFFNGITRITVIHDRDSGIQCSSANPFTSVPSLPPLSQFPPALQPIPLAGTFFFQALWLAIMLTNNAEIHFYQKGIVHIILLPFSTPFLSRRTTPLSLSQWALLWPKPSCSAVGSFPLRTSSALYFYCLQPLFSCCLCSANECCDCILKKRFFF